MYSENKGTIKTTLWPSGPIIVPWAVLRHSKSVKPLYKFVGQKGSGSDIW